MMTVPPVEPVDAARSPPHAAASIAAAISATDEWTRMFEVRERWKGGLPVNGARSKRRPCIGRRVPRHGHALPARARARARLRPRAAGRRRRARRPALRRWACGRAIRRAWLARGLEPAAGPPARRDRIDRRRGGWSRAGGARLRIAIERCQRAFARRP